jgi:hypothetical protein
LTTASAFTENCNETARSKQELEHGRAASLS